jgi:hypothetical protein
MSNPQTPDVQVSDKFPARISSLLSKLDTDSECHLMAMVAASVWSSISSDLTPKLRITTALNVAEDIVAETRRRVAQLRKDRELMEHGPVGYASGPVAEKSEHPDYDPGPLLPQGPLPSAPNPQTSDLDDELPISEKLTNHP